MRIIGKTTVALLAAYGARFAFHEIHWIYKNRELYTQAAKEGGKSPRTRWTLVKK